MNTQPDTLPKKRGPKPIGDAPMTPAQRQQRRRQRLRATGAKDFLMKLEGLHLEYIEKLAQAMDTTTAAALRLILIRSLDQYVGVVRRVERMQENGVPDDVRDEFFREHLFPELPPILDKRPDASDA